MYVCKFQEGQGLGNQLWNYVSIKAIANDSNKPFGVINLDLFKGKDFINLNCQQINEPSKLKLYKENYSLMRSIIIFLLILIMTFTLLMEIMFWKDCLTEKYIHTSKFFR